MMIWRLWVEGESINIAQNTKSTIDKMEDEEIGITHLRFLDWTVVPGQWTVAVLHRVGGMLSRMLKTLHGI